jgi:ABC-2 type transport system permease protein
LRFVAVFKAVTRNWLRSRSGLFFSFLFPVIFLLLFASIFSASNSSISLAVQNNDVSGGVPTPLSVRLISVLNSTQVLAVTTIPSSTNASAYLQEQAGSFGGNPRLLIIPDGFQQSAAMGRPTNLTYLYSPADQSGAAVAGVISSVADSFNLQLLHHNRTISVSDVSFSARPLKFVDYYMPGLIAAFMMTNGVIGLTNVATEFRRIKLIKRLSATPLTKLDWIIGNVLSQTLLAMLLSAVMIIIGVGLYHSTVVIDVYTVATLVVGAVLFSGVGMTLAGLVSDPEAASGLGNAIAFPMMFLSGTFWSLDVMPYYLQVVARFLPLTYFADGLRDSMILNNHSAALTNLGITAAFAVAFIAIGAWATRWEEK